jgi:nitrite reductase/ring-hydroxylating ferredoxin subunit
MKLTNLLLLASLCLSDAYMPFGVTTRRSTMTMKRGRGSFKEVDGPTPASSSSSSGGGGGLGNVGGSSTNWIIVPKITAKDLPKEEGIVSLIDTQALKLIDKGTNPTGAVSVIKYGPETYCFSVQCPSCKIPLTKAKALPPSEETGKAPRLACDFCKATFNLKTGEKVTAVQGSGLLGNIAKAVLQSKESGPLPIYQLGEKSGKILFSTGK